MPKSLKVYAADSADTAHRVFMYWLSEEKWKEFSTEQRLTQQGDGIYVDKRGGYWYVKPYS